MMSLAVNSLPSTHVVTLSSETAHLQSIARDLCPENPLAASLEGSISIRLDTAGFVHAEGHVTANAVRPCDLCGDDVRLPLSATIKATFRPPYEGQPPRELNLLSEDLDVYFIESGRINLEVLLNDTLQCAIPYHITCESQHGSACSPQRSSAESQSPKAEGEENSPFAVLKSLK